MFVVINYAAFGVSNKMMLGIIIGALASALIVSILSNCKRCPQCKSYKVFRITGDRFKCNKCGKAF